MHGRDAHATNYLNRIRCYANIGIVQRLARHDIELPTVPGAAQDTIRQRRAELVHVARTMRRFDGAPAQRRALVRTDIFHRVEFARDVEHADGD
jgi:hypothetical protein